MAARAALSSPVAAAQASAETLARPSNCSMAAIVRAIERCRRRSLAVTPQILEAPQHSDRLGGLLPSLLEHRRQIVGHEALNLPELRPIPRPCRKHLLKRRQRTGQRCINAGAQSFGDLLYCPVALALSAIIGQKVRTPQQEPACAQQPHEGRAIAFDPEGRVRRSEEHTSELQSLMRIPYAVFCLKKNKQN